MGSDPAPTPARFSPNGQRFGPWGLTPPRPRLDVSRPPPPPDFARRLHNTNCNLAVQKHRNRKMSRESCTACTFCLTSAFVRRTISSKVAPPPRPPLRGGAAYPLHRATAAPSLNHRFAPHVFATHVARSRRNTAPRRATPNMPPTTPAPVAA